MLLFRLDYHDVYLAITALIISVGLKGRKTVFTT